MYDNSSNRIAIVDGRSNRITFVFDNANRLNALVDQLGYRTTYGCDAVNNQTLRIDALGARTSSARFRFTGRGDCGETSFRVKAKVQSAPWAWARDSGVLGRMASPLRV